MLSSEADLCRRSQEEQILEQSCPVIKGVSVFLGRGKPIRMAGERAKAGRSVRADAMSGRT